MASRVASAERLGRNLSAAVAEAETTAQREAEVALRTLTTRREVETAALESILKAREQSSKTARTDMDIVALRRTGLTLREIGERIGLTRERVRQRLAALGCGSFSYSSEELTALGCVYVAAPVDIRGNDAAAAMAAVREAAEALGLNTMDLDARLKWRLPLLKTQRLRRLKLARDAEIARGVARGEALEEIALRIGFANVGSGHKYPSMAIRKRMELMGLYQKRKRLRVKRGNARRGVHPFDAEIDAGTADGQTYEQLAAKLDLSIMYVSKRARRGTVKLTTPRDERLQELRLEGLQCKEIAKRMGESRNWVSNRVTLLGLPAFG